MRIIKPTVELIEQEPGIEGLFKHMELCARTCYKSEDRITEDSARKFINDVIVARGHTAMLEHGTVYLRCDFKANDESNAIAYRLWSKYNENQYSEAVQAQPVRGIPDGFVAITTNYRVLLQNNWLDDLKYLWGPTIYHANRVTVKFTIDRGVSHEFVRHRKFSFAQESTRYCNYSKGKFGNECTFIIPCWVGLNSGVFMTESCFKDDCIWLAGACPHELLYKEQNPDVYNYLLGLCKIESCYLDLLSRGWKPQQARAILPNSLKTELIMTGTVEQWIEFFKLRCARDAHPQAKEVADQLRNLMLIKGYITQDEEGNLQVSKRY